jgi:ribose 5-phosphate isomerase A
MDLKQKAALQALSYVHSGMAVGLGTGSTTGYFIDMLGHRLECGALSDIVGIPTSAGTAAHARAAGIPLADLTGDRRLDLAVDGADEVDPKLNLIKGLGQALLREKIVEIHADRFVVVVDESKLVPRLGQGPLPVEIVPFGVQAHLRWLCTLGCRAELWRGPDDSPVLTDNGNYLARCWFAEGIADAYELANILANRPGVVEHGLFLDMATCVIVAASDGIRVLEREPGSGVV